MMTTTGVQNINKKPSGKKRSDTCTPVGSRASGGDTISASKTSEQDDSSRGETTSASTTLKLERSSTLGILSRCVAKELLHKKSVAIRGSRRPTVWELSLSHGNDAIMHHLRRSRCWIITSKAEYCVYWVKQSKTQLKNGRVPGELIE